MRNSKQFGNSTDDLSCWWGRTVGSIIGVVNRRSIADRYVCRLGGFSIRYVCQIGNDRLKTGGISRSVRAFLVV